MRPSTPDLLLSLFCTLLAISSAEARGLSLAEAAGDVVFTDTNWGAGGLALQGYDVVEYHNIELSTPGVQGTPNYAHNVTRSGYIYEFWFKDQDNLEAFMADPAKYIPKYGGFCVYGTAGARPGGLLGTKIWGPPAEPKHVWTVYKGSLYFNPYPSLETEFESRPEYYIERANQNWIEYFGSLDEGPINTRCYTQNYEDCLTADLVAQAIYGRNPDFAELTARKERRPSKVAGNAGSYSGGSGAHVGGGGSYSGGSGGSYSGNSRIG